MKLNTTCSSVFSSLINSLKLGTSSNLLRSNWLTALFSDLQGEGSLLGNAGVSISRCFLTLPEGCRYACANCCVFRRSMSRLGLLGLEFYATIFDGSMTSRIKSSVLRRSSFRFLPCPDCSLEFTEDRILESRLSSLTPE